MNILLNRNRSQSTTRKEPLKKPPLLKGREGGLGLGA
jgi:hypothetical protein